MVARAIARRIKAAQAQQAQIVADGQARARASIERRAQYGDPQAQALIERMKAAGVVNAAPPAIPVTDLPAVTPAKPPVSLPAGAGAQTLAPDLGDDRLPGLPTTILDDMAVERPMLLAAFSGSGMLPAIVFAEALSKPMALREGGPGNTF